MSTRKILAILLGALGAACTNRMPTSVFEWVQGRDVKSGSTQSFTLPSELRDASADGKVYATRLGDGRLCAMVKMHIGYKDNFDGALRCDAPLTTKDIVQISGRPCLSLPGDGLFEELYVRKRIGDHEAEVFFDLN